MLISRLYRITSHPFFIVNLLFILYLTLFLYITNRPTWISPPGYTYTILGKNFYYPSMIRQSQDGAWGIKDTHTTRPTPRVYAQLFFVFVGKISAIFRSDPVQIYQISRVLGGLAVFLTTYWIIRRFLPPSMHIPASILALATESGPQIQALTNTTLSKIPPAWDTQILMERRFGLPHHTFGEALGLIFLGAILLVNVKPTLPKRVALAVIGFFATTTLPPNMITLIIPTAMVLFIWGSKNHTLKQTIQTLAVAGMSIGFASIFIKLEFNKGLPWSVWTPEEKSWITNTDVVIQYLQTLALFIPGIVLFCLLVKRIWKQLPIITRQLAIICLGWICIPLLLIPFSKEPWFPMANFRLVDGYQCIPAGILATIGIMAFVGLFATKIRKILVACIIAVTLMLSSILTYSYTAQTFSAQENFWSNIYPTTNTWNGILYMKNLPPDSGVMVREYMGEMLPAFGPVRAFIGGAHGFPDWPERQWITGQFYSGTLNTDDAKKILRDNDISYVFWGPDEKQFTKTPFLYPTLLTPVFSNPDVTIFSIR